MKIFEFKSLQIFEERCKTASLNISMETIITHNFRKIIEVRIWTKKLKKLRNNKNYLLFANLLQQHVSKIAFCSFYNPHNLLESFFLQKGEICWGKKIHRVTNIYVSTGTKVIFLLVNNFSIPRRNDSKLCKFCFLFIIIFLEYFFLFVKKVI